MPNIFVKVPEGILEPSQLEQLAKGISEAAYITESIPDDPGKRILTWVMVEEIATGHVFAGGHNVVPGLVPVVVQFYLPALVLDATRREVGAERIHQAVLAAVGPELEKRVLTSCMLLAVPDGHWGAQGQIWTIEDFARVAGYEHLQHLVTA